LLSAHKKGISSLQLSRDLGITQKTAWFVLHRLRLIMGDSEPEGLDNIVFNTRKIKDKDRFSSVLSRTEGRLTYKKLIEKI